MEGESGVTRSIIDELHSVDIQGDQMEGEGDVTRSIIDELYFSYTQVVLLKVSLINFILRKSKEIK